MSFTAVGTNNHSIWGAQAKQFTGSLRSATADFTDSESQLINKAETVSGTGAEPYLSGTALLSGASYYIVNHNSGMAIDLPNGKLDEGTNIQQWERNGSWAQQWRIISVDKDYCRIVSVGDESMCMAVAENSAADGVNIELQKYSGKSNQLFRLVKSGLDYGIVSKCSEDKGGLDVYEWSKENGGNINQWNYWEGGCQLWSLLPVHPAVTDGSYTIRNVSSGLYLFNMKGKIVQFNAQGISVQPDMFGNMPFTLNDQIWTFTRLSDGTYSVKDKRGKALTSNEGQYFELTEFTGDDSQKFTVICNSDGSYSLTQGITCADLPYPTDESEKEFCVNLFTGSESQKFVLEPIVPEETTPVFGDINGDGSRNVSDLVLLQKYLLKAETVIDNDAADLNGDGVIDVFDNIKLRKLLTNN